MIIYIENKSFAKQHICAERGLSVKCVDFRNQGHITLETPRAFKISRMTCTTTHQRDSLWKVSSYYDENCGRNCAHKKFLTDRWTDNWGRNILRSFEHMAKR